MWSMTIQAGEIGHFNGGVMNIRDYLVPDPGFYGVVYNYFYTTDRINDSNGDEIRSVTINPGPGPDLTVGVEADVDMYALAPTLLWVTEVNLMPAKPAYCRGTRWS